MEDLIKSFEENDVLLNGHFVLSSGRHAKQYINKDRIFSIPSLFWKVVESMVVTTPNTDNIDIITGPAIAGAVLASNVAMRLNKIFVYPEKINGKMVFQRGYDKILKGKHVFIIEDIITTGGSVNKTIISINGLGGIVTGVSCIWSREDLSTFTIPMFSLIDKKIESWGENNCPMCREGIPLTNPKTGEIE
jgi:orotate phosphoribosyltransferase